MPLIGKFGESHFHNFHRFGVVIRCFSEKFVEKFIFIIPEYSIEIQNFL